MTVPPPRGATWRPTSLNWVLAQEFLDQGGVEDVSLGDPASFLGTIPLPVNQELATLAPDIQ